MSCIFSSTQPTEMQKWAGLLLVVLLHAINATVCPNSYYDIFANGLCYKIAGSARKHSDAEADCNRDFAQLAHIHNSFENSLIFKNYYYSTVNLWIGLRCTGNTTTNCYWDDDGSSAADYDEFLRGPDMMEGYCVFAISAGKNARKWQSGDCEGVQMNYVCQYDPSQVRTCGDYLSNGGHCYRFFNNDDRLDFAEAEAQCQRDCAHLVSIHNIQENSYVLSKYSKNSTQYVYLGSQRAGVSYYNWVDRTNFDYDNFDSIYGSKTCAALAWTSTADNTAGQWTECDCTERFNFVCKRDNVCNTTTPAPYAQPTCSISPYTYSYDGGNIRSPSYPNMYTDVPQTCEYQLVSQNGPAWVKFDEMLLDPHSSIEMYNDLKASSLPVRTFNGPYNGTGELYTSSTGTLRISFNADRLPNENTKLYRWKANYDSYSTASFCNSTHNWSGRFASDNYPNNYNSNSTCYYLLNYDDRNYRSQVEFGLIDTNADDVIRIYDGNSTSAPLLGSLSGVVPNGRTYVASKTTLLVTFTTGPGAPRSGWAAYYSNSYINN